VRISTLRVDGYGKLADLELGPIDRGLTVVLGPNEAGKSTLLDFVRGVLFGFPDRRQRLPFHEPLRGGRHGGAVGLVDEEGEPWLLERHVGRAPVLVGPDGSVRDIAALQRLVGGADDALFRSVFAFGLGELAAFESLDRDEVRELVFSAGVLGAGRSASVALRAIDQQRQTLVRPRQQEARANQLRLQLDALDESLRSARAAAATYAATAAERDRLRSLALAARSRAESLHRRARELERLESCWAPWRRGREAAEELADLGPVSAEVAAVREAEFEIRALGEQLSGHEERSKELHRLAGQHAGIERSIELRLAEIGFEPSERALPALDIGLEDEVTALGVRQRAAAAAAAALAEEEATAQRELAAIGGSPGAADSGAAQLDERRRDALELRGLLATLDRLEGEAAARRQAAAYAALAGRRPRQLPRAGAATALVLALALASAAVATRRPLLLAAAGAALLVALTAAALLRAERRRGASAALRAPDDLDGRVERVRADVAARGDALGLGSRPEREEVELLVDELEEAREGQRRAEEVERAGARVRERLDGIRARRALLDGELAEIATTVGRVAEKLELAPGLTPDALARAIDGLRSVNELIAASARVAPELAAVRESTADYESRLSRLCARLGLGPAAEAAASVGALTSALQGALADCSGRERLESEVLGARRLLEESLGEGDEAERLRGELTTGTLAAWGEERLAVEQALADVDASYEELLGSQLDAERSLGALASSEDVASLSQERELIATELAGALSQWLRLGLAGTLIQRTLARYEAERQPLVIARAGALFSGVTGGAYEKLVAREEADQRHHGIEAITPSGVRVDAAELSRGTAEQLYLCLRLAFAATFAERSVALPLLLDDVLVNFDADRAGAMSRAIATVAEEHQVIVFTCHPHLAEAFLATGPGAALLQLSPA